MRKQGGGRVGGIGQTQQSNTNSGATGKEERGRQKGGHTRILQQETHFSEQSYLLSAGT